MDVKLCSKSKPAIHTGNLTIHWTARMVHICRKIPRTVALPSYVLKSWSLSTPNLTDTKECGNVSQQPDRKLYPECCWWHVLLYIKKHTRSQNRCNITHKHTISRNFLNHKVIHYVLRVRQVLEHLSATPVAFCDSFEKKSSFQKTRTYKKNETKR